MKDFVKLRETRRNSEKFVKKMPRNQGIDRSNILGAGKKIVPVQNAEGSTNVLVVVSVKRVTTSILKRQTCQAWRCVVILKLLLIECMCTGLKPGPNIRKGISERN